MNHIGLKSVAILLASTSLLAMPTASFAQIDEIVTTAQRRTQNVQDVPLAVTAFSPEQLEERQIDEPLDLVQYVPNFYGGNNTGLGTANVYYIRGQGNTESIATFDPPVGTYVDEVYIGRQNGNNVSLFDIEAMEVLRGPQGTLFGRNTTGGTVVTRMRKPAEEFGGFIEAGYGSFDRTVIRGSFDLPLSDKVLTKLSAFYLDDEGYVENLANGEKLNGQEGIGIRADIRLLLTDNFTWDLSADYTEDEAAAILNYGRGGTPFIGNDGDTGDRVANTGLSTQNGTGSLLDQLLAGRGLGNDNESFSVNSNMSLDIGSGDLNLILGYRSLDQEFIIDFFDGGLGGEQHSTGGFAIANDGEHDQFSAELKYTSTLLDDALDLVAGLYYFGEDNSTDFADVFTLDFDPGPGVTSFPLLLANRVLDNELTSYAAYAQGDYHVTDRLTATIGARWTEETKEIEYTDANGPTGPLNTALIQAAGIDTKITNSLFTPRFALNYDLNDGASVYASATRGFKSGGWNARGTSAELIQPFGPEKVWNYEAGLRSVFADNRVLFNATLFFMDVQDLQAPSAFVNPVNGSISFITRNFADMENKGIELDFNFKPNDRFKLYVSAGFQDAEYSSVAPSITTQAAACAAGDPSQAGVGIVAPDCSIGEPVRVPDITVSVGGSYDIPLGTRWTLTPSANVRVVGETFTGTSNLAPSFEDGYTLVNAGISLTDDNSDWRFTLECKNCTDTAYITNNLPPTVYLNDPKRWHIGVRRNF